MIVNPVETPIDKWDFTNKSVPPMEKQSDYINKLKKEAEKEFPGTKKPEQSP